MGKTRKSVFSTLGKAYAFEIMELLDKEKQLRFSEIKRACGQQKVLSDRLRELEEEGLIAVKIERIRRRALQFYMLSEKGKEIVGYMRMIRQAAG